MMDGLERGEFEVRSTPLPHRTSVPTGAPKLLHCAVRGFEIPSFPALEEEYKDFRKDLIKTILYRFQVYITELHGGSASRAIALQFMSHPDEATLGARVRAYFLCRSANEDPTIASNDAGEFDKLAQDNFPSDGIFAYGKPRRLSKAELARVLFHPAGGDDSFTGTIAEIRKFEESQTWAQLSVLHYVPHRLWSDERRDPWLSLIETLASVRQTTAIRIELTPVRLVDRGLEFITRAGSGFDVINDDLERNSKQGEQVRADGMQDPFRQEEVMRASANAACIAYVRRGAHVYEQLNTFAQSAFCMRIVLASEGELPESVIGSVRAAVSTPPAGGPHDPAGWYRPEIVRPTDGNRKMAVDNLRYMAQTRWGRADPNVAGEFDIDLRPVVTPEEAVALFHLPIYNHAGMTSAVSTVDNPFVIPPEALSTSRDDDPKKKAAAAADPEARKKKRIVIGHMFQRETLLDPEHSPDNVQPFRVTVGDLMKPSLLVGAPGSGKTNLAMSMLKELWEKDIPFLVLDPSTGKEFRDLLRVPSLKDKLVVYTVGTEDGFPLYFNPFSVPPDVTVRSHTTRLLAAFRAAIEMEDPVPAVFEGALERLYTDEAYLKPSMTMEAKGGFDKSAPSFTELNKAMRAELKEKVLPLYAGSEQTIGTMRGASTMRVNAIGKKLGYILNVKGDNANFMQELLRRPAVIEMGALGDSSNIALVMAFFLSQLAGHIEYAHGKNRFRQHVIVIEEAHRLLGSHGEKGASSKSAEDLNTMLAEVRKFGQGILVMDQRPSSLVGGVLDNSNVKMLMRLSDREGFERLSDELNLNEAQQRFARTRLKAGDAILLDRDSGQPILFHGTNFEDAMAEGELPVEEIFARVKKNAKDLIPMQPTPSPYEELPPEPATGVTAAAAASAATAGPMAGVGKPANPAIEKFAAALGKIVSDAKKDKDYWRLWYGVKGTLLNNKADLGKAREIVEAEMKSALPTFRDLTDELWQETLQAVLDVIVGEPVNDELTKRRLRNYVEQHLKA